MEAVAKESGNMQGGSSDSLAGDSDTNTITSYGSCYRCGYKGHSANTCRFKTVKCHVCQKMGHLARVCRSKQRTELNKKHKSPSGSKAGVHQLQDKEQSDGSDSNGELFNIFQLSNPADKFIVSVKINGIKVDMEGGSGAQRSTVPWSLFQGQLATACRLMPTSVTLRQYDQSPLDVKGECRAEIQINDKAFSATFIVVDVSTHYPLFGRDWMYLLDFDVAELIGKATAPVARCVNLVLEESLLKDFAVVFNEELGLIRGSEAKITVDPAATPKFHRHRPVPFALKEKVEASLKAQVSEGELIPVEQSEWAAPTVVINKKDGGIRICGDFKVSIKPVICPQVYPCLAHLQMWSPTPS